MLKSKILKTVYAGFMSGLLVGVCNGQEVSAGESPLVKLNGIGVDYTSKYVWRGFELFGSKGAYQPSVDMSLLGDSGLGLNVWGSMPMGSGYEAFTELDYTLSYGTTVGEEEMQLDIGMNYIYFDYPKSGSNADVQEIGMSFGMPNLLPMGLGMGYYVGHGWSTESGMGLSYQFHSFSLSKEVALSEEYSLSLFGDVNYNNDMFYGGSDFTHTTVGAELGGLSVAGVSLTPFVSYQSSLVDDPVITDSLFGGLKASYSF